MCKSLLLLSAALTLMGCASSTLPPPVECPAMPAPPATLMLPAGKLAMLPEGRATAGEVVQTVSANYAVCHATSDRLTWLQEWVRAVHAGPR